ncbi:MAG: 4-hydroxybenzoate polyprenyltransferase [Candidatus Pelagibacterales bacterium]|nr:MAG: 4-hydroxybenzoate polyprenyltransferase [Pelagibacterales bacterium]
MKKIKTFIELTRLNKPTGYMLLFWPSLWGLTLAYNQNYNAEKYLIYILYFFLGSVLMRSAGCIVNDVVDKDFDQKVKRTKDRPIASEKISLLMAIIYILFLCTFAFLILIQFNFLTIALGLLSMPFAFSYPYMKRITYWPQLFLGITFNFGIIMGWASLSNGLSIEPVLLYFMAIFWTLGYDTIYGYQDIYDDEIIGVKSTSIKFKNNPKIFIGTCYLISITLLIILSLTMMNKQFYLFLLIFPLFHFLYQLVKLDIKNPDNCLKIFKSNNLYGLIIFLTITSFRI